MMKRVGILYHPRLDTAHKLAERLKGTIHQHQGEGWLSSAWGEAEARALMPETELVLSVGGDGTILRAARAVVPLAIPILGINLGWLGFMTELTANEAEAKLPAFLGGGGWVEERAMLQADIIPAGNSSQTSSHHALNDVVVGRGHLGRLVHVQVKVEGEGMTTYRADGLIVATATGSTGYSLSAGGPILHPEAQAMVLQPIAPHFCLSSAVILPPSATVEMELVSGEMAMASIDGQVDMALKQGDRVQVQLSPYSTRFLRARPPTFFYQLVGQRLSGLSA